MDQEFCNDSILNFYIAKTNISKSLKTKLFLKRSLIRDLAILKMNEHLGITVRVDAQLEFFEKYQQVQPESSQHYTEFFSKPMPRKPISFANQTQRFPLIDSIKKSVCKKCAGKKYITCYNCSGTGSNSCSSCGGSGNCSSCNGWGEESCSCINDDDCIWCHGSGDVDCSSCNGFGDCSSCGGDGSVICNHCSGSGIITCTTCRGEGNIISFDVAMYIFMHQFREQKLINKHPFEVLKLYQELKHKDEYDIDFQDFSKDIVKEKIGYLNLEILDQITDSLQVRDFLKQTLKNTGGKILYTNDSFNVIPITHLKLKSERFKTNEPLDFWTLGTLKHSSNINMKLPCNFWKIIAFILLIASLTAIPVIFVNYWDTSQLINLELTAFIKLLPVILSIFLTIFFLTLTFKKKAYRNMVLIGTDYEDKNLFFSGLALDCIQSEKWKINDSYIINYQKKESNKFSPNPNASLTYTLIPKEKTRSPIKVLNLNSRSLINAKSSQKVNLLKNSDWIVIFLKAQSKINLDLIYSSLFKKLGDLKSKKMKILFCVTNLDAGSKSIKTLKSIIPQTTKFLSTKNQFKTEMYICPNEDAIEDMIDYSLTWFSK